MAKKVIKSKAAHKALINKELSSLNFIVFLALAFILLVTITYAMNGVTHDLRTRAGFECPTVSLPAPEACPGGKWEYSRSATNGCPAFVCNPAAPTDTSSPAPTE
jgi:hypothetical protein